MKEPEKHLLCFQFGYLRDTDEYHILGKTLAQSLFSLQLKLQLDLQHNFEVIVYLQEINVSIHFAQPKFRKLQSHEWQ